MSAPVSSRAPAADAQQQQEQQEQQQQQPEHREEQAPALAAARPEQPVTVQLVDVADVLLASGCVGSVLVAAASLGRFELLQALLARFQTAATTTTTATSGAHAPKDAPPKPDIQEHLPAAFLAASGKGHSQCLKLLLDCGAASAPSLAELLDTRDENDSTALMHTSLQGNEECMQLLLEYSPLTQVVAVTSEGCNALMYAAIYGHTACLQRLLEHSPGSQLAALNTNVWNQYCGWNALMMAADAGHAACLPLLLAHDAKAQMAVESRHDESALSLAAANGHVACLKLLLAEGAKTQQLDNALLMVVRKLDRLSRQPVAAAAAKQRGLGLECFGLLLTRGAKMPSLAMKQDIANFWPINQELVSRALLPDVINEAVVGLAFVSHAARRDERTNRGCRTVEMC